ncbi:MAG: hypothetical protein ABW080_13105 [Candidatus Thiodiazotropha sp.]
MQSEFDQDLTWVGGRLTLLFLRRPDGTSLCRRGLRGIPAATPKENRQPPGRDLIKTTEE